MMNASDYLFTKRFSSLSIFIMFFHSVMTRFRLQLHCTNYVSSPDISCAKRLNHCSTVLINCTGKLIKNSTGKVKTEAYRCQLFTTSSQIIERFKNKQEKGSESYLVALFNLTRKNQQLFYLNLKRIEVFSSFICSLESIN